MTDEELRGWAIELAGGDVTQAQKIAAFVRPEQGVSAPRKNLWGAFGAERDALLKAKWSTATDKKVIVAEVNALPGPTVTEAQVARRAVNVLGLRRRDFVSPILAAARLNRHRRENGAEPPQ